MIIEYHRPLQLKDALNLIARTDPLTVPIGGGSALDRIAPGAFAVVDLQALGLNFLRVQGNNLEIGASFTLQALLDWLNQGETACLASLGKAIQHEASYNLRQVGSVAGTLVAADGRSPFATTMLALDAVLQLEPGGEQTALGDLLPLRAERLQNRLITQITIPGNVWVGYESVARSPADRPIVCVSAAIWPSGRARIALGGFGLAPTLAFDGADSAGVEIAARSAYSQAGDQWASAEYRAEVAGILASRVVVTLSASIQ